MTLLSSLISLFSLQTMRLSSSCVAVWQLLLVSWPAVCATDKEVSQVNYSISFPIKKNKN